MSDNQESKKEQSVAMSQTDTSHPKPPNSAPTEPENAGDGPTKDVKSEVEAALKKMPPLISNAAEGGTAQGHGEDIGNTTNDLQQEAIKALALKAEKERLAREKAEADAERSVFADDMQLRLDALDNPDNPSPIILAVDGDLIVGRADNVTDYSPEIDLTPHGAYRLGLSRRHALIRRQDVGILVKDLSSRNGTFVNGEQVEAGKTLPLRDGDELRFGNLALRISFQRNP